ncbi:MAG: reverse gyrase [Ignisphaera sp.]|nr:reverse gyrase [Ignisphaera sp.]MCX8167913.1 reverse gyrase [Ignisphaera sp.]MDW8085728.1 reverse gyrase [Ignisphaera sp.]
MPKVSGTVVALSLTADNGTQRVIEKIYTPRGIYLNTCINCGGAVEDCRSIHRNACKKCMKGRDVVHIESIEELAKYVDANPSGNLYNVITLQKFVKDFEDFFAVSVGGSLWSLERSWALRVAQNQSFAMIAPTGVGKTTFGLVMSIYLAYKFGKKVYILVPTTVLVQQYEERIQRFLNKLNIVLNVAAVHARMSPKRKIELEENIRGGYFDIVISTPAYLRRSFDRVFKNFIEKKGRFGFIFVDDVDAVMKGSRVVEYILRLMGFDEKDIEMGYRLIDLRRRMAFCIDADSECLIDGKPIQELIDEYSKIMIEKRKTCGLLIVSSATGRARGRRIRLFKEVLGFSIGSTAGVYRNVIDTYIYVGSYENAADKAVMIVNRLGNGGIILVPQDLGVEYAQIIVDVLRNRGVKADLVISKKQGALRRFINNEVEVLVGVATYYGLLVRGIDIPERIRYVVFLGVPRHKVSLTRIDYSPQSLLKILSVLVEVVEDRRRDEVTKMMASVRRIMRRTSVERLKTIVDELKQGTVREDNTSRTIQRVYEYVKRILSDYEMIELLKQNPRTSIIEENGALYMLIPDAPTYLQACGRTSRLYVGGITRGLSILLAEDHRLLRGLEEKLRFYIDEFEFKEFDKLNIDEIVREIDEDRNMIRMLKQGVVPEVLRRGKGELSRIVLFIVESPNKARTIASFFGRPTARIYDGLKVYETTIGRMHLLITATGGHIFDVVEEGASESSIYGVVRVFHNGKTLFLPKYDYIKRCLGCGTQFVRGDRCPICGSGRVKSSRETINMLQRLALEVDEVLIATDPDAEGEKIAYDVAVALAPYAKSIKRVEFHEVTRRAILSALSNPRGINLSLVEAQITRRIEDRWFGFALSEYVTKVFRVMNVNPKAEEGRLSAGRVQTPILGKVLELYITRILTSRTSKLFSAYDIVVEVPQGVIDRVLGKSIRLSPSKIHLEFKLIDSYTEVVHPPPPFTTDELIAEAQKVLHLDASEIMDVAQDLFESGFITYHRTDSVRTSPTGISIAREYLKVRYGKDYEVLFNPRTWSGEGAHECIRPTRAIDVNKLKELIAEGVIETPMRLANHHLKLYDLIFRRFIASQMNSAKIEKTKYLIKVYINGSEVWQQIMEIATGIVEPGFTELYSNIRIIHVPRHDLMLTPSKIKTVKLSEVRLPTQGDLVRWMKSVGIGRPSTYAKIVEILMRRGYVIKSSRRGVLIPSADGFLVYTLLAGTEYPEAKLDLEIVLSNLVSKLSKRADVGAMKRMIEGLLKYVRDEIKSMVSIEQTRILYDKMQRIETGKLDYVDIINELHREMCMYVLPYIHGDEVRKLC